MRQIGKIGKLAIALILCLVVATSVLGVVLYQKYITVSVRILAHGFSLYSDENCTLELTSIPLGDLDIDAQGEIQYYFDFWIKSKSTTNFNATWSLNNFQPNTWYVEIFEVNPLKHFYFVYADETKAIKYLDFAIVEDPSNLWNPQTEWKTITETPQHYQIYMQFYTTIPDDQDISWLYKFLNT